MESGPFNFGGSMTEHFIVIKKGSQFVVRYKEGKVDVASYPSYLRAKFRAYLGNRNIEKAEEEFNMGVR